MGTALRTIKCVLTLGIVLLVCQSGVAQVFQKEVFYPSDSSKLKEVLHFTVADTVLEGTYESFHLNGSLKAIGFYKNGLPDSSWIYYYENGRKRAEGTFRDGKTANKWIYYYENGSKKSEGMLIDNVQNGNWTFYYENGNRKSNGDYRNDLKQGIWTYYFEDETLKAQAYYENGSGVYKEFYPSGELRMEGMNKNDKSEGEWVYYYETGEIEAKGYFKNGLRVGEWVYYHKNGKKSAVGNFIDGTESGVWNYFHQTGNLMAKGDMSEGEKDGFWKLYYPSGELRGEGDYVSGDGTYVEYYPNGARRASGNIKGGKKDGEWTYYNEEGIKDGEANFEDGSGIYEGYYPDGTVKMTGMIINDKRAGEWKLYNPDGSLAGTHRSIYEEEEPIFKSRRSRSFDEPNFSEPGIRPDYNFERKKIRNFVPVINEYSGIIIGTNPIAPAVGNLPISIEYYKQERLGYEFQFILRRDPFFTRDANIPRNERYSRGGTFVLRQKLYNKDRRLGLLYFGHQVGVGYSNYSIRATDDLFLTENLVTLRESNFYYGLFIGNRWMRRAGNAGWSIDAYVGFGAGVRNFTRRYSDPSFDDRFDDLLNKKGYFPVLFGVNIGLVGPKRKTTTQL